MRAAILSIGDELISGQTLDGNARWLAGQLAERAVTTVEFRIVADDRAAIGTAIGELARRADVLLVTGGIGPTADDLTRQALGDVLTPGRELVTDPVGVEHLKRRFRPHHRRMPPSNRVQAQRPPDTRLLANPRGTALGIAGEHEGCRIYVMPGPPVEMRTMYRHQVMPELDLPPEAVRVTGQVHALGLGESAADERLGPITDRRRRPKVGITHSGSIVTARIIAEGPPPDPAATLAETRAAIVRAWTPYAYGVDDETIGSAVVALLRQRSRRLVTAESCTGGGLAKLVVDVAGASDVYVGGWVTYSDDLKRRCLDVPADLLHRHGAVSAPVAGAMAVGALAAGGADEALAVTGIAGPSGGSPDKEVGSVFIAHARRDAAVSVRRFRFPGDRETVRDRSAKWALQMLRWALLEVGRDVELLWEVPVDVASASCETSDIT